MSTNSQPHPQSPNPPLKDPDPAPMKDPLPDPVQGEGDYKSAAKFNQAERAFVKSGGVEKAAGKAAPVSEKEADELAHAEQVGRSHSKAEPEAATVSTSTDSGKLTGGKK